MFDRAGGSIFLTGCLFSLYSCLFQLSLLAHVVELQLELPLPLIIQERRPSTHSDPVFTRCVSSHRGENGTEYDAE